MAVVLLALPLSAQDTRMVAEPVRPAACVTLDAQLAVVGDTTLAVTDEARLDTPRIQQAINGCAAGQAVVLRAQGAKRAFVSGALQLKAGVTLVVDTTAILFASRDPRQFDTAPGACGVLSQGPRGCKPLIAADRADHSGVMGPGTIDGRGWAALLQGGPTWWEMAEQARDTKYSQQNPRLIVTTRSNDFTLYRLTLRNSPNFHVVIERADGFTAWGVIINTPRGARNTDGIDPSGSRNVSIVHSYIHTGDDNIAIKAGGAGAARNITVANSHFYNGHGVSVGSETDGGGGAILVRDVTFVGTDNALRIKSNGSRGGLIDGVTYENVCIKDVKYPIYMDTHYSASPELDGDKIPHFRNVVVKDVRIMGTGTVVLDGYDATRMLGISFDRVVADTPARIKARGGRTQLTIGANGSNLVIPDSVAGITGARAVKPTLTPALQQCEQRFVPFPGGAAKPVTVKKLAPPPPPKEAATSTQAPVASTRSAAYRNPVLFADFSDPDVIRDGDDFWMTSSSFGHVPGLPILHSRDLVHWSIVNHAIPRFADSAFNAPQHGNGVWAPSIRKHDDWFWIYYGDPDRGIYMTKARDPRGAWSPPLLVQAGKGLIDPTPLWDDDGKAFLVHAYARSRAGVKHQLVVRRMRPDGEALIDSGQFGGKVVFLDSIHHPTAEGPKFYKRGEWYWIFAPAGGVATGWQLAMRSRSPLGPYEARVVLQQGETPVNGPHQGAWVTLANDEQWFLHFQDRGAYGRIVHLQPMRWRRDGWPVIGGAKDNVTDNVGERDTVGTPVTVFAAPHVADGQQGSPSLQMSDEFDTARPGLQWQWQGNPQASWIDTTANGVLRLRAVPLTAPARNLWDAPNLLMQKFPAEAFDVNVQLSTKGGAAGDRVGFVVFGLDYAWLGFRRTAAGWDLVAAQRTDADKGQADVEQVLRSFTAEADVQRLLVRLEVRGDVRDSAVVTFRYSTDGATFETVPGTFLAREGRWVGAKFGLFATSAVVPASAKAHTPMTLTTNYVRVKPVLRETPR
jgi:beta-xylosidase